jgi:DeoR/GlpR family transcriptional regulator of sugar metabolism
MNNVKKDILLKEKQAGELILLYQILEERSLNKEVMETQESLSNLLNKTRPTIKKYLDILEKNKLIKQEYGKIILLGDNNE